MIILLFRTYDLPGQSSVKEVRLIALDFSACSAVNRYLNVICNLIMFSAVEKALLRKATKTFYDVLIRVCACFQVNMGYGDNIFIFCSLKE